MSNLYFQITTDCGELCSDLIGSPSVGTARELEYGMRLELRGAEIVRIASRAHAAGAERGVTTAELLTLALSVPVNVASSVAAGIFLEHFRPGRAIDLKIRRHDGSTLECNLSAPDLQGRLAVIIEEERGSDDGAEAAGTDV